jgi:hypothetical protein
MAEIEEAIGRMRGRVRALLILGNDGNRVRSTLSTKKEEQDLIQYVNVLIDKA